jgi:rhodanese-related sulfurtransferase
MLMTYPSVTPPEAYAALQSEPGAVYLDVRTAEEFEAGHPAGARNVPVLVLDAGTRQAAPNPEFVATVIAHVPRSAVVLVGCQSGVRSLRACELLVGAGYENVRNVDGGFGGARDQFGHVVVPGWRDAQLPVEMGQTPGDCWADLRRPK